MEFLGGWNKEEDDEEGDGIILSFFFFFLGETFGLGLCFSFVLTFTVLVWFWIVIRKEKEYWGDIDIKNNDDVENCESFYGFDYIYIYIYRLGNKIA